MASKRTLNDFNFGRRMTAPKRRRKEANMAPTTTTTTAEALAGDQIEVVAPGKAPYARVRANGRTLAYATQRKDHVVLEFFSEGRGHVKDAPKRFQAALEDTGGKVRMRVTNKNLKGAKALLDWLAKKV